MTINIFVLKGDLNGKIVVVRFFFFVGYIYIHILFVLIKMVLSATVFVIHVILM